MRSVFMIFHGMLVRKSRKMLCERVGFTSDFYVERWSSRLDDFTPTSNGVYVVVGITGSVFILVSSALFDSQ